MEHNVFSSLEMDAIGEIMNISLGSSATAVSNMLNHRVNITTPKVSVITVKDFTLGNLNPAVGVEIKYVAGLEGSNLMLMKRSDIKVIVDILLGSETPDEEFELNELTISAVCEVMNQMMGAASTALSDFLGRMVNISPPSSIELDDFEGFKNERFPNPDDTLVVVKFSLSIEGALESEFLNIMSVPLARDLVSGFSLNEGQSNIQEPSEPVKQEEAQPESGAKLSQAEIEKLMNSMTDEKDKQTNGSEADKTETSPVSQEPKQSGGASLSQEEIERLMGSMASEAAPTPPPKPKPEPSNPTPVPTQKVVQPQQPDQTIQYPSYGQGGYPPQGYPMQPYPPYIPPVANQPVPKMIKTKPVPMPELIPADQLSQEQAQNLDLIMSVPVEVTVEIGRTKRKVQDILAFTKGSLVMLDKLAGDQVDLFVNGKCIARGDVVVIDDNFGIRITEILQKTDLEDMAQA